MLRSHRPRHPPHPCSPSLYREDETEREREREKYAVLVQVFARAYARVCMCARAGKRAAWFTAPNSLCCLHRGVSPPHTPLHTSFTFGSQCGFCEIGPFRLLCRVILFLSRVLDRLRGGAQSRSSVVLVGEFTAFPLVRSLARSLARVVEHLLRSTLTLPRQPFVINICPPVAKCRTSTCVRSARGLDRVNPRNV